MATPWTARCESALCERRGGERKRAAGAGPLHQLVFTDRVLVTVAVLRLHLPHAVLAETARSEPKKKWRPLRRYIGRRDSYGEIHAAIADLVADRGARRLSRGRTSTELVPARPAPC